MLPCLRASIVLAVVVGFFSAYKNYKSFSEDLHALNIGNRVEHNINFFQPKLFAAGTSTMFLGMQFATSLLAVYITSAAVFALLILLTSPELWVSIGGYVSSLSVGTLVLTLLGGTAMHTAMVKIVGDKVLSDGHVIKRPRLWSLFSSIMFPFGMLVGITFALTRVFQTLFKSIGSLFVMRVTVVGKTDRAWLAYWSCVMTAHVHQSPEFLDGGGCKQQGESDTEMLQNSSSMQSEHAERRGVKEDDDLQSRSLVVMT